MLVTAIAPIALEVGANRIVRGQALAHPFGDPSLAPAAERAYRARLIATALRALTEPVTGPTVLES